MDLAALFNSFFRSQPGVTLVTEFLPGIFSINGVIYIQTAKGILNFAVEVPNTYPFSNSALSIRFVCTNFDGFSHLNRDGSVCIYPTKTFDPVEKLDEEYSLLQEWIQKYYIGEKKDDHYEYLITPQSDRRRFLFTDISLPMDSGECGTFEYSEVTSPLFGKDGALLQQNFLVQSIDKVKCDWSNAYKSLPRRAGYWFVIADAPVVYRRKIVTNWFEIEKYFTQSQLAYIYSFRPTIIPSEPLFVSVLIGYNIPSQLGTELHWQAVKIYANKNPVSKDIENGKTVYKCVDQQIEWMETVNVSYSRFFGRGGFCDTITSSKILIIGCGAIGSSLGEILTRGGCRNLTLIDHDNVEAGNICRATFEFKHVGIPKISSVYEKLVLASPFVNVEQNVRGFDKALFEPNKTKSREFLNNFDYIFDCTTDMECCYVLDQLKPSGRILNFSISNHAAQFACITGVGSISDTKSIIFPLENNTVEFYEGTGCWNPTFEASFFDINAHLNLALKIVDHKIKNGLSVSSFVIKSEIIENVPNLKIVDY